MKVQQMGKDYYLFFDRSGQKVNSLTKERTIVGGEMDSYLGDVFEIPLFDSRWHPLEKKVIFKRENNEGVEGVVARFERDTLTVLIDERGFSYCLIHNHLTVPLENSEGCVRIVYVPVPFYSSQQD